MTEQTSYLDAQGTYWVMDRDQLVCLASPRRHDIVDRLVGSGPMSIKDLAALIGADPPALYHHIRKLVAARLVAPAGVRVVNRRREQLYEAPGKRMRLSKALGEPANRDIFVQITASLSRQMERDFRKGSAAAAARTMGPQKTLGFSRLIGTPGPEGMAQINRRLEEIAAILWDSPRGTCELVCLSWVLSPIAPGDDGEED
jgi:DNA-binding transcriptional ArsR family regulator